MSGKDLPYGGNPLFNGHKPQPQERRPSGTGSGTSPAAAQGAKHYDTIAVDFDGTICENCFPEIGKPKPLIIEYLRQHAGRGTKIILYTCRENGTSRPLLDEAVAFCEAHGIPLYAVNENPGNPYPEQYGTAAGRKVYADLYIDDRATNTAEIEALMAYATRIAAAGKGGESS